MAWYKRYRIPFASRDEQYMIYILERTDGTQETLTAASSPFVTKEDDSTDIYIPMRVQTGTLRLYDSDGTLLERLIPTGGTEKMVRMVRGSWSGQTFTDAETMWHGFLQAGAYTQGWEGGHDVLELPVHGMLGALECVHLDPEGSLGLCRIASLVTDAAAALDCSPWNQVTVISDHDQQSNMFGLLRTARSIWVSRETIQDVGGSTTVAKGETWRTVLEDVARTFGLQFRESGTTLYIAQYDAGPGCVLQKYTLTWSEWAAISNDVLPSGIDPDPLPSVDLLTYAEWYGTGHRQSYEPGRNSARVVLKLGGSGDPVIELPDAADTEAGVHTLPIGVEGQQLLLQPQDIRTSDREGYTYAEMGGSTHQFLRPSDYTSCLVNSGIFRPYYDPYGNVPEVLYTGCFPVRWALRQDNQPQTGLQSGMWMVQSYRTSVHEDISMWMMYHLKSAGTEYFDDGYLDIQGTLYTLEAIDNTAVGGQQYLRFITTDQKQGAIIWTHHVQVALTIGDYVWNPTTQAWVVRGTSEVRTFAWDLPFNGPNVADMATDETPVRNSAGYLIPVSGLSGQVTLYVFNFCESLFGNDIRLRTYNHLLTNLSINYRPLSEVSDSERTENVYWQYIGNGQQDEEASSELKIGTNNNNVGNRQFLRESDTLNYVRKLVYSATGGGTIGDRPESHLLARMVTHYSQTRRSMNARLRSSLNLYDQLYTYRGRTFFALEASREWAEDTTEVQFVEV